MATKKPDLAVCADLVQFPSKSFWTTSGEREFTDGKTLVELVQSEATFWASLGLDLRHLAESGASKQGNMSTAHPFYDLTGALEHLVEVLRGDALPRNLSPKTPLERLDYSLESYSSIVDRYRLKSLTILEFEVLKNGIMKYDAGTLVNVLEFFVKGSTGKNPQLTLTLTLKHIALMAELGALRQPLPAVAAVQARAEELLEESAVCAGKLRAVLALSEQEATQRANAFQVLNSDELQKLKQLTTEAHAVLADAKKQAQELKTWFDETLPISEVVVLWRKKEVQHKRAFWSWATFGAGVLGVSLAYLLPNAPAVGFPPKPTEVLQLLRWGVELSIAVWAARTGLKFAVTSFKLREDAGERAVMAATFMSLERTKPLDTSLKSSVMSALFRPSGIDGGPDEGPVFLSGLIQALEAKDKKGGP